MPQELALRMRATQPAPVPPPPRREPPLPQPDRGIVLYKEPPASGVSAPAIVLYKEPPAPPSAANTARWSGVKAPPQRPLPGRCAVQQTDARAQEENVPWMEAL